MRFIALTAMMLCTTACGSNGGSDSAGSPASSTAPQSMYITTTAELPACKAETEKQLVYVSEESKFKSCQGGNWADVTVNTDSPSEITSIDALQHFSEGKLCTANPEIEKCDFFGGTAIRYKSGLMLVSARLSYVYYTETTAGADSDRDDSNSPLTPCFVTKDCVIPLNTIARKGVDGYQRLWLIYKNAFDQFSLVFDSNANQGYDPSIDETVGVVNFLPVTP